MFKYISIKIEIHTLLEAGCVYTVIFCYTFVKCVFVFAKTNFPLYFDSTNQTKPPSSGVYLEIHKFALTNM